VHTQIIRPNRAAISKSPPVMAEKACAVLGTINEEQNLYKTHTSCQALTTMTFSGVHSEKWLTH